MSGARFDTMSKLLATRRTRRTALHATGGGIAAALAGSLGIRATAQEATPDATGKTEFLFVQTATGGSFSPNPGAGTPAVEGTPTPGGGADYLLTLEGHPGGTVYFSNRPQRVFGEAPTDQFLEGFDFSPHNPPNAALVTDTDDGEPDVVVLELLNPTYDEGSGTMTYGATILSEYKGEGLAHVAAQDQDAELPETFGRASLFIDDCPDLTVCLHLGEESFQSVGPIPGGPYGTCWNWLPPACIPCHESMRTLVAHCENAYAACSNNCNCCRPG